ncbi:MAG: hypothetical protein ACNA8P_10185 [Phycisphaerales bacterium]
MNGRISRHGGPMLRLCVLVGACSAMGAFGGCQKALFPQDAPRTQFDRYDRSRDAFAPPYIEDEFGRQRPNLQGRLSPR